MSFLSDLIFGMKSIFIGSTELPARPAVQFVGATAVDDPVNKRTVVSFTGSGAAPATRTITAGAGLQGGGDLSANRTLAVKLGNGGFSLSGLALYGDGLGVLASPQNGVQIISGFGVAAKPSVNGGIGIGQFRADASSADAGIGVKLLSTAGLSSDNNGLFVLLPSTGGLQRDATGLAVKLPVTPVGLLKDANGLDVDASKVAVLSGGKITAAHSRGQTLQTPVTFTGSGNVSIPSTGAITEIAVVFVGNLAVGDWIDVSSCFTRDGATTDLATLQINSSATLGAGTIYDTLTAYVAGGTATGSSASLPALYQVATAGPYYVHLAMNKVGAASAFNAFQRRLTAKPFHT